MVVTLSEIVLVNQSKDCLASIDTIILAGGLGTRLRPVLNDQPKILAPINGTPFLDILLARLNRFGARRIILGLGHLGATVVEYLEDNTPNNLDVTPIIEPEPLGTAGALRFLSSSVTTDPVLVMNGDSLTGADLCDFVAGHQKTQAEASLLCTHVEDASRYGSVEIDSDGKILKFHEKSEKKTPGFINAGVYLFNTSMLNRINASNGPSLEKDVFQTMPSGSLHAVTEHFPFIDIGTPESLKAAADIIPSM